MSNLTNPYRFNQPVNDPAMLFGRRDALDWLERQLYNNAQTMVFSALPLIGKTSLIKNVGAQATINGLHLIVSLFVPHPDGRESSSLNSVLRSVTEQLTTQFRFMGLLGTSSANVTLRELFAQVEPQIANNRLIVYWDDLHLLLDNDLAVMSGFLSTLTPLLEDYPQTHFVFTLNQEQLRRIRHPLIDRAPVFHLGTLTVDASLNMVTLPVRNVLRFDYGVTRRITEINSHHPYYLTLFCYTLFNRQMHDGWVNQRAFDAILTEVLDSQIEPFKQLWEQSSWAERAVLAGMAAMQGTHGPMTLQEIIRFLQKEEPSITVNAVTASLNTLAERGILVPMGAVSYRFHVDLLRFWLREHADYIEVIQKVNWHAYAPPKITPPSRLSQRPHATPSGRRRFSGMLMVALLLLFCAMTSVGALAAQMLGVSLAPLIVTPTPTVMAVTLSGTVITNPNVVVNIATPTPVPSPTALPTPTAVPVQVRTLPALTYMARQVDAGWRIYTMNADGSNITAVSPEGADERGPVWSPGGQRIAYISQQDGNREIYVTDADGRNRFNLTQNSADDWTPAWSPDGKELAFSSIRSGRWEIYLMDMTCLAEAATCPAKIRQITNDNNGNISPVFSPDGKRIAFNSRANGDWDIYTMTSTGSDLQQVTNSPANELAPAWSPNGALIAYETDQDGNIELYVINVNGSQPRNITNYPLANDHGPTWSPDSQQLVFYSNREGNWDIFLTTLDGKTVTNLSQTPAQDEQTPSWLP